MSTAAMASWIVTGAFSRIISVTGRCGVERLAEVAVHQALDVLDVLDVEGLVEAALVTHEGDLLRGGGFAGQRDAGSPGTSLSMPKVISVTPNSTRTSWSRRRMM